MPSASWKVLWTAVLLLIVLFEGIALGRPETGDTFTEFMRLVRFDSLGRFLFIPLWTWLTWHWVIRAQGVPEFTWRDVVALSAGAVAAILDSLRR